MPEVEDNIVKKGESITPKVAEPLSMSPTVSPEAKAPQGLSLKEAWEAVYKTGEKISDLNKQLAFAGFAIIWIFKTEAEGRVNIPTILVWAGMFLVVSLLAELFQSIVKGELYLYFARRQEKLGIDSVWFPDWQGYVVDTFLYVKLILTVVAYVLLLIYLRGQLV